MAKNIITKPGYVKGYENDALRDDSGYSKDMINAIPNVTYDENGDAISAKFNGAFSTEYMDLKQQAEKNRVKGEIMGNEQDGTQKMGSYLDSDPESFVDDTNTNKFKYELEKDDNGIYYYDDPLLMAFKINIINDSPLFKNVNKFLTDYSLLTELGNREDLYNRFKEKLNVIFNIGIETSEEQTQPKGYYINKIDGLENFQKKIIKYKEDKLSITLQEDVTMGTYYLSELYNNLIYSYENQRYTIPENLLRFNMEIIFEDIRNYVAPNEWFRSKQFKTNKTPSDIKYTDGSISPTTQYKSEKSKYKVTLYDCNFDFSTSKIVQEHYEQAGFGAAKPTVYSYVTFDIFYKSVKRVLIPNLIPNSITLNNRELFNDLKDIETNKRDEYNQSTLDARQTGNITGDSEPEIILNRNLKNPVEEQIKKTKLQEFKDEQRQGLMSQIAGDLVDTVNIEAFGLSIADMLIGENHRRLLLDGINGLTGDGNFELIKDTIRNLVTTNVNAWRRETLMELNNFIDGEIYGNRWDEDILNGVGQLNDKNKLKGPIYDTVYDEDDIVDDENLFQPGPVLPNVYPISTENPSNTGELGGDSKNLGIVYDEGEIIDDENILPKDEVRGDWEEDINGTSGTLPHENPLEPLQGDWEENILGTSGTLPHKDIEEPLIVYEEGGTIYKPADGVVYEEGGPIYKPADGVVYEEGGYIYKPADGVAYEENGPVYKPADGVVYEENGPVYKPADGVVYEENGPIYKPVDGVVYEENGPIYKPADGVAYTEPSQYQNNLMA